MYKFNLFFLVNFYFFLSVKALVEQELTNVKPAYVFFADPGS